MPSIAAAARAAEALHAVAITVAPERCARYRHKASTCEFCAAVCPANAVSFDEFNAPAIDEETCTGCGACSSVCPTGALECAKPDDREIEADVTLSIEINGAVIFACARSGDVSGAIRVPCLARIDVSLTLDALARGAARVHLVSGDCDSCPSKGAGEIGGAMADTAASLAASLGRPDAVILTSAGTADEAAEGPALSRRAFFLMLSNRGAEAGTKVARALVGRDEDKDVPDPRLVRSEFVKHVPASRTRLSRALTALTGEREAALDGFLFSIPTIDADVCRGCEVCSKVCPTGALASTRVGDTFTLAFDSKACTSCYLCEDVCDQDAITRSEGVASAVLAAGCPVTVVVKADCEDPLAVHPEKKLARLFSTTVSHA